MSAAAPPTTLMVDPDVEMTLDPDLEDDPQPTFIFMVINSLPASDGPASPPIFRDALGPADAPLPDSPASPDPYGDEGSSDAESVASDSSMASTIIWSPRRNRQDPRWWMDSGMSEADEADSSDDTDEEDEGRLVMDLSPRSPSPPPEEQDDDDDEDERSYYLGLYQSSLQQYIDLLVPRQP